MKIGYISYEYPPDTAFGGIATYVYQVGQMMKSRGHVIEVFCASPERTISETYDGILVHRVQCAETKRLEFSSAILDIFLKRHAAINFDIIESPEYSGDGIKIKKRCPDLTLVVKLHTPHYLIHRLNTYYDSFYKRVYYMMAYLRKGSWVRPYWLYKRKEEDPDYQIIKLADQIHTPSVSLGQIVSKKWGIRRKDIYNIPYPYIPKPELLSIPVDTSNNVVTYVGRLEVRKGIVALCKAIPMVLSKNPGVKFKFSGAISASPVPGMDTKEYIMKQLEKHKNSIEFMQVPGDSVYEVYAASDICVFPSIWENFPNVCLEAMSAARGIVASEYGGMKDMLENPKCGLLVNPLKVRQIADSILFLINNPEIRKKLGTEARNKVLKAYNRDSIGKLMEEQYYTAIVGKKSQ